MPIVASPVSGWRSRSCVISRRRRRRRTPCAWLASLAGAAGAFGASLRYKSLSAGAHTALFWLGTFFSLCGGYVVAELALATYQ